MGLQFGLYADAGIETCAHKPGSLGHETTDANTFAAWGVDYLKYDNCYGNVSIPEVRYRVMRDALAATGREIFFSMCEGVSCDFDEGLYKSSRDLDKV